MSGAPTSTAKDTGKPITIEHLGAPVGFARASRSPAFQAATADFARDADATPVRVLGIPGAVGFRVDHDRTERELARWNAEYVSRGVFIVRYDNTYGYGGRDQILAVPTRDKYAVLRAVGTDGINYDIQNHRIVNWLRKMERRNSFVLTEAGPDYVAGRFRHPVRDADELAREMYRFSPDIVEQGTGTVPALAREFESTQLLFLWWD